MNKVLDTIWQCFHIGEPYSYTDKEFTWKFDKRTIILYIFQDQDNPQGRCSIACLDGYNVAFLFDDVSVEQFEIAQAFLFKEDMRDIENNSFKLYDLIVDTMIDVNFEPESLEQKIRKEFEQYNPSAVVE